MKLLKIKCDFAGRARRLGDEVFVWRKHIINIHANNYPNSMFQLISSSSYQQTPGYHHLSGYITVCPVEQDAPAFFLGVKRCDLRKLSKTEIIKRGINH